MQRLSVVLSLLVLLLGFCGLTNWIAMASPIPGGTVGRTDQGIDISAPAGTNIPDPFGGSAKLIGTISGWFKGQPLQWFKQLTGKFSGQYFYVAEQFRPSSNTPGTVYQQGQSLGSVASSGTGIEEGFATASGQTLARATTGYTEGQATPAGLAFRRAVTSGTMSPSIQTGSTQVSLAQLWIDNGGPPGQATTAAAVAMAESSGRMDAVNHNTNGSTDYGPWQVNSIHGFDPQRLLTDPNYSAKAAISVWRSSGWGAWTTYQSGAYKQFMGKPDLLEGAGATPITRPGGDTAGSKDSGDATKGIFDSYDNILNMPRTAPTTKNPVAWWYQSFTGKWGQ